jgi:hypothetical protein
MTVTHSREIGGADPRNPSAAVRVHGGQHQRTAFQGQCRRWWLRDQRGHVHLASARAGHPGRLPRRPGRHHQLAGRPDTPAPSGVRSSEPALDHQRRPPQPKPERRAAMGATLGGATYVWRTGIGIESHGNLIYARCLGDAGRWRLAHPFRRGQWALAGNR